MSSHLNAIANPLIYGTAWKKERTADLVVQALRAGFRCFDTAAQPKHYREDLVGEGIRKAMMLQQQEQEHKGDDNDGLRREDLYIQTKFTAPSGQDETNMPYNPTSPLAEQIRASIESSLSHLRPNTTSPSSSPYIDCLILHSPYPTISQTLSVWQILETYVPSPIRTLGISNTDLPTLQSLYKNATVKPAVVQNRFHALTHFDVPLRHFCLAHGIVYQAFWTLTANPRLVASGPVANLAAAVGGVGKEVAFYALVLGLEESMVVLNGTTSGERMREDWEGVEKVRKWREAGENKEPWQSIRFDFLAEMRWEMRSVHEDIITP